MAPIRPLGDDAAESHSKRKRSKFDSGPDNLPDGPWRRKIKKTKQILIQQAKVKKSYAKIKAREVEVSAPAGVTSVAEEPAAQELHPDRQAMLDAPREASPPPRFVPKPRSFEPSDTYEPGLPREKRPSKKPAYFAKELAIAEKNKADRMARQAEHDRREKEKKEKIEERERFRKAMAKARTGGKNGQRKLGRESAVLLEKVQRLVGS